ncbi:Cof-type HAD-IIB family hydrolase [Tissierella sp.]|uniref:Cof-type HAD-IIB family hydrolase n=1 Tax=Tissierella sp. TaxID=41274 RepID=UPI0028640E04|nr:Cof-type HAD-IIB family hydrolase [Tissierella sp.]MDR7857526.1 Cof-type HAD-IIB family hydrolase [Tissierella sp.]
MKYKMIALDIDGTLVDKNVKVHTSTIEIIKRAIHKGIIVTLSTGRMYPSAKAIADKFGIDYPLIVYNGAEIRNPKDNSFAFSKYLPLDISKEIILLCKENNLYLQFYEEDSIVVEKIVDETRIDPDLAFAKCKEVGDLSKYTLQPCPKMMIVTEPHKTSEVESLLLTKFKDKIHITRSKPYLIEIIHPMVSKANALETLANKFNISQEEVIAIGDGDNDIEMIKWAGLGISVGNATETLKNYADYVTRQEYNLGVEEAINKFT